MSDESLNPSQYLLQCQVARLYGCDDDYIRQLRLTGKLPFSTEAITGRPIFKRSDVEALIAARDAKRADRAARDAEILKLHGEGRTLRQIGRLLGISPEAVSTAIKRHAVVTR